MAVGGDDRSNLVGVFATPVRETELKFTINPVPGHIQLSGDCDWGGGWDG